MTRGGYRAGAGRPKGKKIKAHSLNNVPKSELTPEEKEKIRLLLSFGARVMDGGTLTRTETKQLEEIGEYLDSKLTLEEKRLVESFK